MWKRRYATFCSVLLFAYRFVRRRFNRLFLCRHNEMFHATYWYSTLTCDFRELSDDCFLSSGAATIGCFAEDSTAGCATTGCVTIGCNTEGFAAGSRNVTLRCFVGVVAAVAVGVVTSGVVAALAVGAADVGAGVFFHQFVRNPQIFDLVEGVFRNI